VFDPFSDDPQLGVQKIVLCCTTETLFVGGTAGQVVVLHFEHQNNQLDDLRVSLSVFSIILMSQLLLLLFFFNTIQKKG